MKLGWGLVLVFSLLISSCGPPGGDPAKQTAAMETLVEANLQILLATGRANPSDTPTFTDTATETSTLTPSATQTPSDTPRPPTATNPPPTIYIPPPATSTKQSNCHPSYPTVCIPPPPPDLDCADIPYRRFPVVGSDPHHFDGDGDGVGCESG